MVSIPTITARDLYPEIVDGIDPEELIKAKLLFTIIDEQLYAVTKKEHIHEALNLYGKLPVEPLFALVDEQSFERLYNRYLELRSERIFGEDIEAQQQADEAELAYEDFLKISQDILATEEAAPVIKFVNALFYQAIKQRASDIHIEPHEERGVVRLRIDGVLIKHADLDKRVVSSVISRIKVISNLDISEKRIPQDGRTRVKIAGKNLDVRVSVLPTYHGERVVMRILMESESIPGLEELGFDEEMTGRFKDLLAHSYGMILVTGPTGSGKSTTLHSFLHNIATPEKNIITIEDPVEYKSHKINQIQVNPKVGLTFAAGLRSILRQDPDVIMVGEIRDTETAQIAVQAALTGHLLLSTLHTNNATSAITRLVDMGIEPFLITASLLGVLSQRLVRTLCPHCKVPDTEHRDLRERYGIEGEIYAAKGCARCHYTGYIGRSAVGELFLMDDEVRKMIKEGASEQELRRYMESLGLKSLPQYLKEKVASGQTSLAEALRVGLAEV
jgi:general secretion pathway protein E